MHNFCLINGEIKKTSDPVLLVNDLGVLRGYGVFDFMPLKDSIPLYFEDYWKRFRNSAEKMMLPFDFDQTVFKQQLQELISLNNVANGYCRIILTGGYSTNGFTPEGPPNLMVTTQGPVSYPERYYTEGIKLITMDYVRDYPQIKSINYTTVLLQRERLKNEAAEDVLYVSDGTISESSRSNFFIIDSMGMLITPATGILSGITRKNVLEIARENMRVKVMDFTLLEATKARAAFMTSTTRGVMPVTQIDDIKINNGKIHPIIKNLQQELDQKARQYILKKSIRI